MAETLYSYALRVVLANEGGLVTDTAADAVGDPGGVTNYGITQHTLDRLETGLKAEELTYEQVADVYQRHYWLVPRGPAAMATVSPALALALFDASVQHGLNSASRVLQVAIGATPDGAIGPKTLARVEAVGEGTAVVRFHERRRLLVLRWAEKDAKRLALVEGLVSRVDLMERTCLTWLVEETGHRTLDEVFGGGGGL